MASWKKVIVSGSAAALSNLEVDLAVTASYFKGDGSALTGITATGLDIDNFGSDLTGITVADTDKLAISDGGTEGRINTSQIATYIFNKASDGGDASIASDGAITINSTSVEGTMLNTNVADTSTIEVSSNTLSVLKVPNALTAGAGLSAAGTFDGAAARQFNVDSGSFLPFMSSSIFGTVSGDIAINAAGVATIQADSVALGTDTTGNYVQSLANATNGGTTITNGAAEGGAATVAVDLNDLSAGTVAVAADSIAFIDADDNSTKKESVADLVSGVAGTGLAASSGQLSVSYGASAGNAVQGNTSLTLQGTSNEIEVTGGSVTLGSGGTVTVGLPDSVTIASNLTIGGDLTVYGDAVELQTANLLVEDAFILLASGSAATGDSGIIFGGSEGAANSGNLLFWDASYNTNDGRLSIATGVASNATGAQTPAYSIAGVFEGTEANAATAQADHAGNIRIDSDEIYIYV